MARISVSEGIGYLKALQERHKEILALRNSSTQQVSRTVKMGYGDKGPVETTVTLLYDLRKLDKTVITLATTIRKLDSSIKRHNATHQLEDFDWQDELLGQIEAPTVG